MEKRQTARPGREGVPTRGPAGGGRPRARRDWRAGLNWRAAIAREKARAAGGNAKLTSAVGPDISGRAGFEYSTGREAEYGNRPVKAGIARGDLGGARISI